MGDDIDEQAVILPDFAKQFDFILSDEFQTIEVIAKLIELAKRILQRSIISE